MLSLVIGFLLELVIGDPEGWPHPVRFVGRAIIKIENFLRTLKIPKRTAGAILVFAIVASCAGFVALCRFNLVMLAPQLAFIFDGAILYLSLSANQLIREGCNIRNLLIENDIVAARENLSRIVSRETADLDEKEIVCATLETMGEGFSDGFFAPLFWFVIGGPVAAVTYKAINTLDSMVGYKNEKYAEFGWAAAKLYDLVNLIPARLAGLVLVLSSGLSGSSLSGSAQVFLRDGRNHESPNAGIGKAALAGGLQVQLGGPVVYSQGEVDRPFIGDEITPLQPIIITAASKVLIMATIVSFLLCALISSF